MLEISDRCRNFPKDLRNWIIQNCSSILREDGSIAPLSEAEKQQINAQVVDAQLVKWKTVGGRMQIVFDQICYN